MSNRKTHYKKQRLLNLLKEGVRVSEQIANQNGIDNLRQHIHFLRKGGYRYNIITSPDEPVTYYWIDNDK